jgi:hypothetical protein
MIALKRSNDMERHCYASRLTPLVSIVEAVLDAFL